MSKVPPTALVFILPRVLVYFLYPYLDNMISYLVSLLYFSVVARRSNPCLLKEDIQHCCGVIGAQTRFNQTYQKPTRPYRSKKILLILRYRNPSVKFSIPHISSSVSKNSHQPIFQNSLPKCAINIVQLGLDLS